MADDRVEVGVSLDLDTSQYLQAMARAGTSMEKLGEVVNGAASKMEKALGESPKKAEGGFKSFIATVNHALSVAKMGAEAVGSAFAALEGHLNTLGISTDVTTAQMSAAAAKWEDTIDAFRATFGSWSDDNLQFASDLASTIGRSRSEIVGLMTDFQLMATSMGFTKDQAAEMARTMVRLAQDFAEFSGKQAPEVMSAFQMAVAGNTRGLRQMGIVLTDAAVEAELFRLGIEGGKEAADESAIAIAHMNLIIQKTADAHGAAAGDVDTFGGVMNRIKGIVEDLTIEYGERFNQAVIEVIESMGGMEAIEDMMSTIFAITVDWTTAWIKAAGSIVKWLHEWVKGLGGAEAIHKRLVALINLVSAAAGAAWDLTKVFVQQTILWVDRLFEKTQKYADFLKVVIRGAVQVLPGGGALTGLVDVLDQLAEKGTTASDVIGDSMGMAVTDFNNKLELAWIRTQVAFKDAEAEAEKFQKKAAEGGAEYKKFGAEIEGSYTTFGRGFAATGAAAEQMAQKTQIAAAATVSAMASVVQAQQAMSEYDPYGEQTLQEFMESQPGYRSSASYYGQSYHGFNRAGSPGESYFTPDTNGPALYQHGGEVPGFPGQQVPIIAHAEEIVMNPQASRANREFLMALNAGRLTGSSYGAAPTVGGPSVTQNITIVAQGSRATPHEIANDLARLARQGKRLGAS